MPCRFPDSLTPWGQRCGHREGPPPEGPTLRASTPGTPHSQHTWGPHRQLPGTHEPWGGLWNFYFYFLYFKSQGRWANS